MLLGSYKYFIFFPSAMPFEGNYFIIFLFAFLSYLFAFVWACVCTVGCCKQRTLKLCNIFFICLAIFLVINKTICFLFTMPLKQILCTKEKRKRVKEREIHKIKFNCSPLYLFGQVCFCV